jgi:hypothetical protein
MLVHDDFAHSYGLIPLSATRRARTRCARPAPEIASRHAADRKPAAAAADDSLRDGDEDQRFQQRDAAHDGPVRAHGRGDLRRFARGRGDRTG